MSLFTKKKDKVNAKAKALSIKDAIPTLVGFGVAVASGGGLAYVTLNPDELIAVLNLITDIF